MKKILNEIMLLACVALIALPFVISAQYHTANEIRGGVFNVSAKFEFPNTSRVFFDDKIFVNKTISPLVNTNITFLTGIEIPDILTVHGNLLGNGPLVDLTQDYNKTDFINSSYDPFRKNAGIQTTDEIKFVERGANVYFTTDNAFSGFGAPLISINFSRNRSVTINTPAEVYNWIDPYHSLFIQQNTPIVLENGVLLPDRALCFEYKSATNPDENTSRYIGYCSNINLATGECDCKDIIGP